MIIRELFFYFKKYKIESFLIYVQFSIIFLLCSSFVLLIDVLEYNSTSMKQIYQDKAIYHLIDGYYEGNDFSNFLQEENSLYRLKRFYNKMNSNENFTYLTMTTQHIGIKGTQFEENLLYGYHLGNEYPQEFINGEYYTPIKSMQMNEPVLEFFHLKLKEGEKWNSKNLNKNFNHIPVILGSNYQHVFKVGQVIPINFYFEKKNIEVIGILKDDSTVLYNNELEFNLNDYILIPYMDLKEPKTENEISFQQKIYFAMVNGYIITENKSEKIRIMMDEIETIGKESEFTNYSFIGYNSHYNKYLQLIKIIKENETLIKVTLILFFILTFWLTSLIFYLQTKNFEEYYKIHFIIGTPVRVMLIIKTILTFILLITAFLTSKFIINFIFHIGDFKIDLLLFMILLIFGALLNILLIRHIKKFFNLQKG